MTHRFRSRLAIATLIATIIGLSAAFGEVWLKCRQPISESCVWGRAFLKLTVPLYMVVFGIPAAAIAFRLTKAAGPPNNPPNHGATPD